MGRVATVVLAASVALNVFLAYRIWRAPPPIEVIQSSGSLVVMRTEGGLLEVSTVSAEERFDSTTNHTVLGVPVGKTTAQIRVPAVYRYHIPLAKEWTMRSTDRALIVIAPAARPSLPVAIDTGKLQSFYGGIWSPMTSTAEIAQLQKTITASLADKAAKLEMLSLQRESARKTVSEFVQKWVVDQQQWRGKKAPIVLVFFEDEPLGAKSASLLTTSP